MLVLSSPQPLGYLPSGSIVALLGCCGLPLLAVMLDGCCSAVAGGVFRCSAQELLYLCCDFTLGFIAGIGSLGLLPHPRCVHGALDSSVIIRTMLFPLCGLTGASFILCFVCSTLLSAKMIKEAFIEAADSLFQGIKGDILCKTHFFLALLCTNAYPECLLTP